MALITYKGIGIKAMAACVPQDIVYNKDLGYLIPPEEIDKTINAIGIKERRVIDPNTNVCASDLCYKAAKRLLEDNNIDVNTIDMLLFLSQSPDYKIPATSPLLQYRLGLPDTTACLDLNMACSGFVYGLSAAFSYASMPGVNRVLLLVGETITKITSRYDKVNWPLYGDAGTATLIEKGEFEDTYFELRTDGSGSKAIMVPAGGARYPATAENMREIEQGDGNRRSDNQIYMDGMDVFNFSLRVAPKSIKNMLTFLNKQPLDIDYLILHQANKFMTDFIVKKLKFDSLKVPYCLDRYGNTSSASIPLTIVSELKDAFLKKNKVILCAFGAGLSWGTVYIVFNNCKISSLIEY
jgi:3-oxoacyl-[acyl-carrier-protein] synthase-3